MAKLPAFQFYPGDWMKDPAVRSVSLAARGLWTDMICLMHESDRRGYLQHATGKPVTAEQLARMTGCSTDEASRLLQELENSGVFSRTDNDVIYSRRIVRDEKARTESQKFGRMGGNPALGAKYNRPGYAYLMRRPNGDIKIGISTNPQHRLKKVRAACQDKEIVLYATVFVDDMGATEDSLHKSYDGKRIDGEWFRFSELELKELKENLTLKGTTKGPSKGTRKGPLKMKMKKNSEDEFSGKGGAGGEPKFFELIPESLRVPKFLDAWNSWIAYRDQRKPAYTEVAASRALPKLEAEGIEAAVERIDRSIINSWQGLFFPGDSQVAGVGANASRTNQRQSPVERQMKVMDEVAAYVDEKK